MILNSEKCHYMTFRSNTTKPVLVLEDDTLVRPCSIKSNNVFPFNILFPFEVVMQKGSIKTKCFDNSCSISYS